MSLSPIQKVQIVSLIPKRLSEKIKLQTENQVTVSGTHLKEMGLKVRVPGERQTPAGLSHFMPALISRLVLIEPVDRAHTNRKGSVGLMKESRLPQMKYSH